MIYFVQRQPERREQTRGGSADGKKRPPERAAVPNGGKNENKETDDIDHVDRDGVRDDDVLRGLH